MAIRSNSALVVLPTVKAPKEAYLLSSRMEPGKKRVKPAKAHKLIGANCYIAARWTRWVRCKVRCGFMQKRMCTRQPGRTGSLLSSSKRRTGECLQTQFSVASDFTRFLPNSTQVIKANQTDIGRKVKRVQKTSNNFSGIAPRREPSPPTYRNKLPPALPNLVTSSNTNLPSRNSKPSANLDILKSPLRLVSPARLLLLNLVAQRMYLVFSERG
jgi:hypothetical protein